MSRFTATIFIITVSVLIAIANQQQRGGEKTPDFGRFPIVDFQAQEPVEPNLLKYRLGCSASGATGRAKRGSCNWNGQVGSRIRYA